MEVVCNVRRTTKCFVSSATNKHSSVYAVLQAAMILACHRAYLFLAMEVVETLQRIDCYHTAFESVRCSFPELSSNSGTKMAITYASSGLRIAVFSLKEAWIMYCNSAVLLCRANESAFSKKVPTQLKSTLN